MLTQSYAIDKYIKYIIFILLVIIKKKSTCLNFYNFFKCKKNTGNIIVTNVYKNIQEKICFWYKKRVNFLRTSLKN